MMIDEGFLIDEGPVIVSGAIDDERREAEKGIREIIAKILFVRVPFGQPDF
jgi:hypothetical protein